MTMREAFVCDGCDEVIERPIPPMTVELDADARTVGGALAWGGHAPKDWPHRETRVGLCADCLDEVLPILRDLLGDDDG